MSIMKKKILICDDDQLILSTLERGLKDFNVIKAFSGSEFFEKYNSEIFDAFIIDVFLPDMNGLEILKRIKEENLEIPVIIITGYGDIEMAVNAMKMGAFYFIKKPFEIDEVIGILQRAIEAYESSKKIKYLKKSIDESFSFSGIIGKNKMMRELFQIVEIIAKTDVSVLIEGESGTGKELFAKAIHYNSQRKDENFVPINCSALPETLLESELFGYKRGAFTGAITSKRGLFEAANGGTLFLDEIGETSLSFQSKLLRVLEEGYFYPLGSTEQVRVDVRIISATNKNLEEQIKMKKFREDLYYRLNVVKVRIPALRERKDDIPLLVEHFLKKYSEKHRKNIKGISEEAMKILIEYNWPGNVRELENTIERAVILTNSNIIDKDIFIEKTLQKEKSEHLVSSYKEAKDYFEREYFSRILQISDGNITKASDIAGMTRQNLYLKLRRLGIDVNNIK